MEKVVLHIEGMSCGHCVKAVNDAVGALPGVASVDADLTGKSATVEYDPALCALDLIKNEIAGQGFEVVN